MAARRYEASDSTPRLPPATTPEGNENVMISLAMSLAEKRLREGTASAQEVTHWLKLGSSREKLEQERLAMEVELLEAKREGLASAKRVEELYEEAIKAMRSYAGSDPTPQEEYDDY